MPEFRPNAEGNILNNDYFGGDLAGITEKIPYLQGLGVTCLYLNPILRRIPITGTTLPIIKIDPLLGTLSDFEHLCATAHGAGMSVILDGVFSHTGSDSVYFNREGRYGEHTGAFRDPQSPYRPWYQFEQYPTQYRSWWGIDTLPNVNEEEPSYLDFICGDDGVLEFWLQLGADGFRLDVADELPDCFLDAVRRRLKKHGARLLIGEVWEDASNKISYGQRRRYLLGSQLDGVMNYPLGSSILAFVRNGGGQELARTVWTLMENYPPQTVAVLMNSLSTHDIPRAITALAGEPLFRPGPGVAGCAALFAAGSLPVREEKAAAGFFAAILSTGGPLPIYGDEAGLSGYRDPFNRCPYPWGQEDPELLDWFRQLGALRRAFSSLLANGDYLPVLWNRDLFCFVRRQGNRTLLVAVNRGDEPCPLYCLRSPAGSCWGRADGGQLAAEEGAILLYES